MPYTSMPAWPNFSDDELSDLAYFIKTFSPDFAKPENVPQPVPLPSAPTVTKESIERGKKLYEETGCVKCHGTLGRGDGPSAPTLVDDWGHPIRPADLTQQLDVPRRADARGHLPHDEHGAERHADAGVRRRAHARAALGHHRLHRLALGRATGPATRTSSSPSTSRSRSTSPRGPRASQSAPVGPLPDRRADHGARPRVPSARDSVLVQAIYDAESIAFLVRWHDMSAQKTGKNGPSLPVPAEEEEGAAASCAGRPATSPFGDAEAAPAAGPAAREGSVRRGGGAREPAVRVLRRRRDPDSVAAADRRAQAVLHLRRRAELGRSLVLRSGPSRSRCSSRARGSADVAANDTGDLTGVANYDQGEWSVIFKRPLRATSGVSFSPGAVRADRLLGLGRPLARARQQARPDASGTRSTSSRRWSHRPSARW